MDGRILESTLMSMAMPKIEPAVTQLLYLVADGVSYVDLAKDLSKVNRRMYRQGMTYVIQDIQIGLSAGMKASDVFQVSFLTTGNSWVVHNAWSKGFAVWRKQTRETSRALGVPAGKWNDFKVYLDDSMEDGTILEPYVGDNAVYLAGEWEHSKLVFDDDGTERELKMHLIGSSNLTDTNNESGIGLIQEYQNSRARVVSGNNPDVPGAASDTIYAKLFATDEMSDILVDNIEGDNDSPPYDQSAYPGGDTNADAAVPVRFGSVSGSQSSSAMAGFIAPCGLIKINTNEIALDTNGFLADASTANGVYASGSAATAAVLITLAPGPYRGVLAAPMGQ